MASTSSKIKKTQSSGFSQEEDSDEQSGPFSDDLLIEIFLRLPVFSILLFKSVCKHWLWLLSDRCFTFRYDTLSKSPGLFYSNGNDTEYIPKYIPFDGGNLKPLKFCFDPCGIIIVQSCNGLLLCRTSGHDPCTRTYYVFNPTTKQCAIIPSIRGGYTARRSIFFMGLAFHQTGCVHYKVVCIRALDKGFQIQMYSSDTGKWKISVESFSVGSPRALFRKGVYWNGAIYLAPTYKDQLYFKIDVKQLKSLTLPVEITSFPLTNRMYFGECRGHLHLIVNHNNLCLDVYEMSCDHSGWSFKYQVELSELPREILRVCHYDFNVVDLVRGEEEEDTFMVLKIPRKLIRYNVHDKSCIIIQNFSREYPKLHRYTATLASF